MTATQAFNCLQSEIHTTIAATVDDEGLPVTCAIDIMDADENGLYFLTAKGKGFYDRLKKRGYLALTGIKGADTLSCVAVSVRGRVRELGGAPIARLFEKNPYMNALYPTRASQRALTAFQLYEGNGEWLDLSQKPIERFSFTFGPAEGGQVGGYFITDACIGCRACEAVCPQSCIDFTSTPAVIRQEHCLRCGNRMGLCPQKAVIREGSK